MTLEADIEKHFSKTCLSVGIWPVKIWPFGNIGFPDRMCLGPDALVFFVELKRPKGGVSRIGQDKAHARLRKFGFRVYKLHTKDAINEFIEDKKYLTV